MIWPQRYDPFHSTVLSTTAAALPIVALLGSLAWLRLRAPVAALVGLLTGLLIAIAVLGMPGRMALASAGYGAAYGLFPIGWIVLNVIFLYQLVEQRGLLDALRLGVTRVTDDRRLQLLLVAFSFGAFMEGAAGFGTPVAVTGGLLIALGFGPLQASGLSLIANTAPVAFGALGTPIVALAGVTGLDLRSLSAQVGHQLPVFSLIVPFWLVWAYAGW
ncbi:MAG TPA: L-lactate permease, partial [Gemmatimonadales bacterium]|nr:L-lactate permease [Gemmatimonadales bacterium]